jgi:hypothetical protein
VGAWVRPGGHSTIETPLSRAPCERARRPDPPHATHRAKATSDGPDLAHDGSIGCVSAHQPPNRTSRPSGGDAAMSDGRLRPGRHLLASAKSPTQPRGRRSHFGSLPTRRSSGGRRRGATPDRDHTERPEPRERAGRRAWAISGARFGRKCWISLELRRAGCGRRIEAEARGGPRARSAFVSRSYWQTRTARSAL